MYHGRYIDNPGIIANVYIILQEEKITNIETKLIGFLIIDELWFYISDFSACNIIYTFAIMSGLSM